MGSRRGLGTAPSRRVKTTCCKRLRHSSVLDEGQLGFVVRALALEESRKSKTARGGGVGAPPPPPAGAWRARPRPTPS